MKHITLIVPDGQSDLSAVACIVAGSEIFAEANAHWKETGRKEPYKIDLAGISKKADYHEGSITVQPQINISSIKTTNLIIE